MDPPLPGGARVQEGGDFRTPSRNHCVYLCCRGRVRFVEERPDLRFYALPAVELSRLVPLLEAKLLHDVLFGGPVRVQVEAIQRLQGLLGVAVRGVRHPAARFHLITNHQKQISELYNVHTFMRLNYPCQFSKCYFYTFHVLCSCHVHVNLFY